LTSEIKTKVQEKIGKQIGSKLPEGSKKFLENLPSSQKNK